MIKQKQQKQKHAISEEFNIMEAKACGTGCHVLIGKKWLGKHIKVKIEEIDDE